MSSVKKSTERDRDRVRQSRDRAETDRDRARDRLRQTEKERQTDRVLYLALTTDAFLSGTWPKHQTYASCS